ncbi:hypothetical protein Tco_1081596 [Tanacetum coccineum]|uniref:Uncharacterized protein n=1 Tax=Tanacetum coccineum TaxID=301880 RepID=A0ABQ5HY35_9ASTR
MSYSTSSDVVDVKTLYVGFSDGILQTEVTVVDEQTRTSISLILFDREVIKITVTRYGFRVIQSIHGVDGRIGRAGNVGHTSIWCDIIKEMDRLASHGIDLISMMHKKIGNGSNTSFWKDRWRGEQRLKEVFFPTISALEWHRNPKQGSSFGQFGGSDVNPSEIGGRGFKWFRGNLSVASARRYIDNIRLPQIFLPKQEWIKEVLLKSMSRLEGAV